MNGRVPCERHAKSLSFYRISGAAVDHIIDEDCPYAASTVVCARPRHDQQMDEADQFWRAL